MPRTCTICRHDKREAIDKALVSHRPFRTIARQFGTSRDGALLKAKEVGEVASAGKLLDHAEELRARALGILAKSSSTASGRATEPKLDTDNTAGSPR